jgi:TRAP-type uncharacterized transport system substrate-binding protein
MLYFLVLIVIVILHHLYSKENFVNYKSVTITPNKTIYDGLVLNIPNNKPLYNTLANKLKTMYPIKHINHGNIKHYITLTNKNQNNISIVPETIQHILKDKFKNIRFITSIGVEKFTLISPINKGINSWSDTSNKNIGVIKDSSDYHILKYMRKLLGIEFKIKLIDSFDMKIIEDFKNNKYDCMFLLMAHPNNILKKVHKIFPLKFIGTEGINEETLNIIFPNNTKSKLDLTYYNIYNDQPDTLLVKLDLITNNNFSSQNGFNLIQTVFKNLLNIKTVGSDTFKLHMRDFMPEYIYLSNNTYKLHDGVYQFYKNIGLITNNPERSCRYKVGISKCNIKKLNHFRLL